MGGVITLSDEKNKPLVFAQADSHRVRGMVASIKIAT
jgi:hypothetical protein